MYNRDEITPWVIGPVSLYAIVRNGVCLADEFLLHPELADKRSALLLIDFVQNMSMLEYVSQVLLRPELPRYGIFAMYSRNALTGEPYNPARLLCSYVSASSRIIVVGAGFIKTQNEPIQDNVDAYYEAMYLYDIMKELNARIDNDEIKIAGSELYSEYPDSFVF